MCRMDQGGWRIGCAWDWPGWGENRLRVGWARVLENRLCIGWARGGE